MRLSCQAFNICCAVQPAKGTSEAVEGVSPPFPCLSSHILLLGEWRYFGFFTDLKQIFPRLLWAGGCIGLHISF